MENRLRIKREEIQAGGMEIHLDLSPAWFLSIYGDEVDLRIGAPIRLDLMVKRSRDRIRIKGTVKTRVILSCARCLEDFGINISPHLDITFCPSPGVPLPKELELTKDDFHEEYYDGDEIDLSTTICEGIFLSLPMKPLCKEECLGLCSRCGANLNIEKCKCCDVEQDPRLMVLKDLNIKRFKGV